ncbi:MAG: Lrp/AsnC family transcriptional regulator [Hadesarchaea archaeon]|nr:MAG: Lrp/AsnC family transcriptional regulator [Hadesarchaea archaeon]
MVFVNKVLRIGMRELDKRILLQLLENSGQPVKEMAKKVGASRQTVAKKIEQLKAEGIITSFTTKLDPEKLGLGTKAYILLREDPRSELRRKNEIVIKQFYQVTEVYRLFGRYSAVLEVLVRNSKELAQLVKRIHGLKGVRETETFLVHSTVKNVPEAPFVRVLKSS